MRAVRRQHGAALIALMAAITIAALMAIIHLVSNALGQGGTNKLKNADTLQLAKTALLGYVAKEALELANPSPGRLPCPESPSDAGKPEEGVAAQHPGCAPTFPLQKTIGRLPWRTLGIDKLYDTASEPLWYVVSQNWVYNGAYPVINPGTPGDLTVDGVGDVVAMIIAPGPALRVAPNGDQVTAGCAARIQLRQDRSHVVSSVTPPDYRDYLECLNATAPIGTAFGTTVKDNATNLVLNDHVVYITAREIMAAIQGPVAERMQRTVAPLLSEHRDKWVAHGGAFLPYAVLFNAAPETNTNKCGSAGQREGTLPTELSTASPAGCAVTWNTVTFSGAAGNSTVFVSCNNDVRCEFRYYRLNFLGGALDFLLGLLGGGLVGNVSGTGSITVTINAIAPNAARVFRDPLTSADVTVSNLAPGATYSSTMTVTPQTDGNAALSMQVTVSSATANICQSLVGLVCNTLPGLIATEYTARIEFPPLRDATVQGTQLPTTVLASPTTMSLLNPVSTAPHYWFTNNQWWRYAYYAVARPVSADKTGSLLTLQLPNGSTESKSLVLALMGPAVTGQTRPSNSVVNYLEGQNASTGDNTFAQQVFAQPGNDRIVTCPFASGASICN